MGLGRVFSCVQYAIGSGGILSVQYSKGGQPLVSFLSLQYRREEGMTSSFQVFVPSVYLLGSGICSKEEGELVGITSMAYPIHASFLSRAFHTATWVLIGLIITLA